MRETSSEEHVCEEHVGTFDTMLGLHTTLSVEHVSSSSHDGSIETDDVVDFAFEVCARTISSYSACTFGVSVPRVASGQCVEMCP